MNTSNIRLDSDERVDETGFGSTVVVQGRGFCYGVDSVLLASYACGETGAQPIGQNARVMDLGTGNGIVPFILAHKNQTIEIDGIEVQEISYDRAMRGLEVNELGERVHFHHMDVLSVKDSFEYESFDAVVTNPPYFRRGAAMLSGASAKMIARHETTATLDDFVAAARYLLKPGGNFYMVHRPDRLVSILSSMRAQDIEAKTIQLIVPHPSAAPNIVLVHGVKGAGEELKFLPEISVHKNGTEYSDEIMRMYERI